MSPQTKHEPVVPTFEFLVASRREWLDAVLKPWCQSAPRAALRLAELEWNDIAGRVAPEKSLWAWAWSRFSDLVHPELNGIDESSAIMVTLKNSETFTGYPDSRRSRDGQLILVIRDPQTGRSSDAGPFSIDEITSVTRA